MGPGRSGVVSGVWVWLKKNQELGGTRVSESLLPLAILGTFLEPQPDKRHF